MIFVTKIKGLKLKLIGINKGWKFKKKMKTGKKRGINRAKGDESVKRGAKCFQLGRKF